MKNDAITEDGVVVGNVYPKYSTQNPFAKYLVSRFMKAVDQLVNQVNPSKIHEVGCGEGHLISRFANGKRTLVGSDFSNLMIEEARRSPSSNEIAFKVSSIYELTSATDSAPLVLCCEVLEHLEFPEKAVDILSDLADPFLIASVPREPLWRILNVLRGNYLKDLGNTPGHLNHWSKAGFLHLLEQRFEILRVESPLPWTVVLCRTKK